ncbi:RICIN domain-containing protein [Kineosporia sp. NBRC 101731]|uniref:RICIN domain-containing protein n=1 Tax=Kineosporia sp. NBRC 101731 TaxID=3032199 RepID=UPI0024A1CCF9|nr:RICIN domain-containing protein [Kineosporia sp. NBRC 101731]GLY29874.1 hypothetical protein Kisp02_32390 [Kineosporia sp. NBRC 101731]
MTEKPNSPRPPAGDAGQQDGKPDEHAEFLESWNRSLLGRRPSITLPWRGLRGVAVIGVSFVAVVGVVLGGMATVQAMSRPDADKAALTSNSLPTSTASSTPTGLVSPTSGPTRTKARQRNGEEAVRTRTRTVTQAAAGSTAGTARPKTKETTEPSAKKTATQQAAAGATTKAKKSNVAAVGLVKNLITGFCLDLPGQSTPAENVLVQQDTCVSGTGDNQEFQTVSASNGSFLLRQSTSRWCLDATGSGSVLAGTPVNTHTCLAGAADNQMFVKEASGSGFFLVNVKSGLCLDVSNDDGIDQPGAKLTLSNCSSQDDHIWTFTG